MFPIPWNFPLRKKNGNLVNIGDAIDEGTELPEHGEGDAGKVLSVDENGDLEWSDDVNSEIQTLTNNLNDEVETRAKVGAHNFLMQDRVPTSSNVTITVNEDKSITISGTTVSESYFQLSDQLGLSGDFIGSGCPSGGSNDTFFFLIVRRNADSTADEQTWKDFGDGVQISLESTKKTRTFIVIRANVTINATFYPMIRLASDGDKSYQPYAMTNRELTKAVTPVKGSFTYLGATWYYKIFKDYMVVGSEDAVSARMDASAWTTMATITELAGVFQYALNGMLFPNNGDVLKINLQTTGELRYYRLSEGERTGLYIQDNATLYDIRG